MTYGWFALLATLIYSPALKGEFVLDDSSVQNEDWNSFPIKYYLTHFFPAYRKLTVLSFYLTLRFNSQIWSIHLINVLLHAFNAWMLQWILIGFRLDQEAALGAAVFFLVHPFAVGTAAYIVQRSTLLSTAFAWTGLWLWTTPWWPGAFLVWLLAIFCKEDAVMVPVVAALLGWDWRSLVIVALGTGFGLWQWKHFARLLTADISGASGWEREGRKLLKGWTYRRTAFTEHLLRWPVWMLGFGMNNDPDVDASSMAEFVAAAIVLGWFLVAFIGFPVLRQPFIMAACSPLLIYMVIVIPDPVFEHRGYQSLAGAAWLFGLMWPYSAVLLIPFALLAFRRAHDWRTAIKFWEGVCRDGSGGKLRALINLSASYRHRGRVAAGRAAAEKAHRLYPESSIPWWEFAEYAAHADDWKQARIACLKAIEICPNSALSYEKLAYTVQHLGEYETAEQAYLRAIEIFPGLNRSMNALANMLIKLPGRHLDAIAWYKKALEQWPTSIDYRKNLAQACAIAGLPMDPMCAPFEAILINRKELRPVTETQEVKV